MELKVDVELGPDAGLEPDAELELDVELKVDVELELDVEMELDIEPKPPKAFNSLLHWLSSAVAIFEKSALARGVAKT